MTKSLSPHFIRSLFEPNPVFQRELRARWRRPAAYLTLFFYAAPLALGMALFYESFAANLSSDKSLATVGKELFEALLMVQVAAWLFISALTAAPVIATERERGLLEALQLANLKASRIVWGKCLSLFSFQALLFLVPLPVVAICFLFGGVDPKTFVLSTITIALTALCGTMIGLYFSSARPRPGAALRDALIFIVVWTALTALSGTRGPSYQGWPLIIRQPLAVVEVIHPFSGLRWMGSEDFQWPLRNLTEEETAADASAYYYAFPFGNPALGPLYTPITAQTAYQLFVAGIGALSLLLYFLTVRATARVLPAAEFMRRVESKESARRKTSSEASEKPTARTQRALYYGLPILSQRSFDNPVFGRELRGKLRWRVASPLLWILRGGFCLVFLGLVSNWLIHNDVINKIGTLHLTLLCLYAAVSGATVFTRERESNTWENLRLSLLTPGQILHGKVWPLALFLVVFSVPLSMVLCVLGFSCALQVTGIIVATALVAGSVAMFISWLARTTQVALGLSLVINAAWLLLFFLFADATSDHDTDSLGYLSWWNPFAALVILLKFRLAAPYGGYDSPFYSQIYSQNEARQFHNLQTLASFCGMFMLIVASILIAIIAALMRQKFRDEK